VERVASAPGRREAIFDFNDSRTPSGTLPSVRDGIRIAAEEP
jgi:hypothetical protein